MNETFADRIELDGLVMLANKRQYLDRAQRQQDQHVLNQQDVEKQRAVLDALGSNGAMPAAASTPGSSANAAEEDGSIVNRSPTTNYHIYQVPQPTAASPAPTPATAAPATSTPAPTTPSPAKSNGLSKWLIPLGVATGVLLGGAGTAWWLHKPTTPSTPSAGQKLPTYSPDTTIKFS